MAKKVENEVVFLEASKPLVKTFKKTAKGITKDNYPLVKRFTSHHAVCADINQLVELLKHHAAEGHCFLKGRLKHELSKESRAGKAIKEALSSVLLFDLDGLDLPSVDAFIRLLPKEFRRASYIIQWSASMGLGSEQAGGLRCHIFFFLRKPVSPDVIKRWMTHLNLSIKQFADDIELSSTLMGLRWPLDITVNQVDKLIYIAAPVLKGGIRLDSTEDFDPDERIVLVEKHAKTVSYDFETNTPSAQSLTQRKTKKINELRAALSPPLPPHATNSSYESGVRVSSVSNEATVCGVRKGEEFTYINLYNPVKKKNGDSWGYFHPTKDPSILYNFKDEANYLLKELCPEYYAEATGEARIAKRAAQDEVMKDTEQTMQRQEDRRQGRPARTKRWGGLAPKPDSSAPPEPSPDAPSIKPFVFIEKETGAMYRGFYDIHTREILERNRSPNMFVQRNFMKANKMDLKADMEEWEMTFNPADLTPFNPEDKLLNTYVPPKLIRPWIFMSPDERYEHMIKVLPPVTKKIIWHVVGEDKESFLYFINWLAWIAQYREKSTTAIIIHGTYGTGKDVMLEYIIKPILGAKYVTSLDTDSMATDQFNGHVEEAILGVMNESDLDAIIKHLRRKSHKMMKMLITDKQLSIRQMYSRPRDVNSYLNILIFANEKHSAHIPQGDRRLSVMKRQETPIQLSDEEFVQLRAEREQIAQFFMCYPCDESKVRVPLENSERQFIQSLSLDSNEEIFEAIRRGDMDFFVDHWPEGAPVSDNLMRDFAREAIPTYHESMAEIYRNRDKYRLSRGAIESLIWNMTGNIQKTAHKATKWCNHNGLSIKRIRLEDGVKLAYQLRKPWKISEENEKTLIQRLGKSALKVTDGVETSKKKPGRRARP